MKKAQINGTTSYVYGLKDNVVKIAILAKVIYIINAISIKIPMAKKKKSQWHFLQKIVKNLKFIGKCKKLNSKVTFLEKEKKKKTWK